MRFWWVLFILNLGFALPVYSAPYRIWISEEQRRSLLPEENQSSRNSPKGNCWAYNDANLIILRQFEVDPNEPRLADDFIATSLWMGARYPMKIRIPGFNSVEEVVNHISQNWENPENTFRTRIEQLQVSRPIERIFLGPLYPPNQKTRLDARLLEMMAELKKHPDFQECLEKDPEQIHIDKALGTSIYEFLFERELEDPRPNASIEDADLFKNVLQRNAIFPITIMDWRGSKIGHALTVIGYNLHPEIDTIEDFVVLDPNYPRRYESLQLKRKNSLFAWYFNGIPQWRDRPVKVFWTQPSDDYIKFSEDRFNAREILSLETSCKSRLRSAIEPLDLTRSVKRFVRSLNKHYFRE